jgi:hypothetical protein
MRSDVVAWTSEETTTVSQPDDPVLRVVPPAEDRPTPATGADATVRDTGRALRLATTVRGVLDELRGSDPSEAVVARLAALHDRTVDQLRELVSDELDDELTTLALPDAQAVSAAELRIVLAELVGWLEGLFHGLSADLVVPGDDPRPDVRGGHYL